MRLYFYQCLSFLLVSVLFLPDLAMAAQPSEPSYLIKQNSVRFGSVTALVNSRHFRMDAMGMKLYMKPPFTSLTFYGDSNKLRYSCAVDHIGSKITVRKITAKEKKAGVQEVVSKLNNEKIDRFNCSHYLCEQVSKNGKREKIAEFWTTSESRLPKALELACCKLTSCPRGYGLPIKIYTFEKGRPVQQLATTKIEDRKFAERAFEEPVNYKLARDEFELMMEDGTGSSSIDSMKF